MTTPHLECGHELRLVADPTGPFWGPLAHGHATGALLNIHGANVWNGVLDPVADRDEALEYLEIWGIESGEQWYEVVTQLLNAEYSNHDLLDAALFTRRELASRSGAWDWASWMAELLPLLSSDGEPLTEVPEEIQALAQQILRYEERMRADRILGPQAIVRSAGAYDFGRAAAQASWGHGAGYCDRATADEIVTAAGEQARAHYESWADFGTSYVLGRAMAYDDGEFGHLYTSSVGPFHILLSDPMSPWLNLPFS